MMEAAGIRHDKDGHEAPPAATLESLMDLSTTVLEEAQDSTRTMTSRDMLAAADKLDHISRRMRELASTKGAPTCADHTPHDADRSSSADEREHGARILLADDLDLNRKLIADMLSLDGHAVDCVVDGAEAVRAVEARRYDLVLMDMVMPGMDGIAATRAIRALSGPARDVPIVALTANAFREQLNSCLEAGMNAVISKPMTIDTLTTAVAQWTRGRDAAA